MSPSPSSSPFSHSRPAGEVVGIEADGLSKSYGPVAALVDVSFTIGYGSIAVMVGANGAGKSTLLRILGTTILPDKGTATVHGHDVVTDPTGSRRATGLVLGDERSWYWRLSGRQNLEFFAALHGMGRRVAASRTVELLKMVQLDDVADRRFDRYSSGMKARLSIARALLVDPPVLLLDEPTRTLDPLVANTFRRLVVDFARDERKAVLWVTHDLQEAAAVGHELLVLARGAVALRRASVPGPYQLGAMLEEIEGLG